MLAYKNYGKATSEKRNNGWKSTLRLSYTEDCFEKSQNYSITDDRRTEYSFKGPVSKKLSDVSFTNPTSMVGLQLLSLWLLKVMLRNINDGVTTIKPGHQKTENVCDIVRWVILHAIPYIRKCLHFENTHGSLQSGIPCYNSETREVLRWFRQQYHGTVFCWSHYYPLWPNYSKGVRGQVE
jgi:hypothetical protein